MSEELNRFFKSISFNDDVFNEALLDRVVFKKGENKFLVYIKNKNVLPVGVTGCRQRVQSVNKYPGF